VFSSVEHAKMTIRFACQCGKRLRASDRMQGRRTQCPACYASVLIPSRRFRGRPEDRPPRNKRNATEQDPAPVPVGGASFIFADAGGTSLIGAEQRPAVSTFIPSRAVSTGLDPATTAIALRHPPRWTRLISRRVEPRWYHSLIYPVAHVPVFFHLAMMLTVLTAFALLGWLSIDHDRRQSWPYGMLGVSLFLLLLVLGRTLNYFNAVLGLAAEGKVKHDAAIDFAPLQALLGCGQWLACFLAGPALLFGIALGYWMYCGDLTVIDWLILAELGVAAVGWWLIAILLINVVDATLYVPLPRHVLRTALGMGWKSLELTLLASAVFLAHFLAAVHGIGHLHDQPFTSFLLLCVAATTGLYLTAFTFRRLGLAYYRSERQRRAAEAQPAGGPERLAPTIQKATQT
jgi:hypothetical protein